VPISFLLFSQAPATTDWESYHHKWQACKKCTYYLSCGPKTLFLLLWPVYNRFLTTVTHFLTKLVLPPLLNTFSNDQAHSKPNIMRATTFICRKHYLTCYDRFTCCSYNLLAPPSTRQSPTAATATWSNTTIGIRSPVIHYDTKQMRQTHYLNCYKMSGRTRSPIPILRWEQNPHLPHATEPGLIQ